jgi:ribosomal-protein-alanine N-acetyltransferase
MPCSNGPDPDPPPVEGARLTDLRDADLEQVVEIEEASFANPWQRTHFELEIHENRRAINRVVRLEDRVLAYTCVWETGDVLKINNIAVRPGLRRRGLGRWLLHRTLDEARRRGCTVARLEVRPSNAAAVRLYRAHGFREVGRLRGYYPQDGEDAIVMEAPL